MLPPAIADAVRAAAAASLPVPRNMTYGTAGFRSHEKNLDGVFLRMGMLAALRAWQVGKVRAPPGRCTRRRTRRA